MKLRKEISLRTFEHYTSFAPITFKEEQSFLSNPPQTPDIDSMLDDADYQRHLREMGAEGWELVSVQPLLKGVITGVAAYAITAGYFLFWKREHIALR